MTIPKITYPQTLDSDTNLYLVKDSLVTTLAKDYNVGDTSIITNASEAEMNFFPDSGIITLTDQCAPLDERAISFYYSGKDNASGTFTNLELLNGFANVNKLAKVTLVVMNVVAEHHNNIKDAIIEVEKFAGKFGDIEAMPKIGSLEARINYLRNVALKPKAWFSADKKVGVIPFTVIFTDLSFRLGTDNADNPVKTTWNFGDGDIRTFNYANDSDSTVSSNQKITKVYETSGVYTVSYSVKNKFGIDIVVFEDYIDARFPAPDEAVITFIPQPNQNVSGSTIRSPSNSLIYIEIPPGINPLTGRTYSGEEVNNLNVPFDPIDTYTWNLSDELTHGNDTSTTALYDIGGIYDIVLRCDTESNSYRITTVNDCIDIVDNKNIWLWLYSLLLTGEQSTNEVQVTEFGLVSETFKTVQSSLLTLGTNNDFLNSVPNEDIQKYEFARNIGFCPSSLTSSGLGGNSFLFWASGRQATDPKILEQIKVNLFNGFNKTYITQTSFLRPYNWLFLNDNYFAYFFLGLPTSATIPFSSPTNLNLQSFNLLTQAITTTLFTNSNFQGNAIELKTNPSSFDPSTGTNLTGNFSIYRSTWKDNAGYFLRDALSGTQLRILSLYGTISTIGTPISGIKKLPDMVGSAKLQGEFLTLSNGLYFFNNSGSFNVYDDSGDVWYTGGTNTSIAFSLLQDKTVIGFNDELNTLLATSDKDHIAYISFDYSKNTFIKFNNVDLTFTQLPSRARLNQWYMGNY